MNATLKEFIQNEIPLDKRDMLNESERVQQHINDLEMMRHQFETPLSQIKDEHEGWWRRGYDDAMRSAILSARAI